MMISREANLTADVALAERYGAPVPRYTSYPTAPHFSEAVDAQVYETWLGGLDRQKPISIYLHVPFCREMCWYCGCFTKIVRGDEPVRRYVDHLLTEIDLVAARLGGSAPVSFIHWGGGSPTIMTGQDWSRVMLGLNETFIVSDETEIAVEMDPRTTTEEYVRALARVGVNRVSIGVQEFDPSIQRAINRVQPIKQTAQVIDWLRAAGIDRLNLDLMYGLPGQSPDHVARMTEQALYFEPQRLALFGYAHVPWMKSHQRLIDETALPGTAARFESAEIAAAILVNAGYVRIGFDHFARPDDPMLQSDGSLRRNFQGYTADDAETLLGFGASAIGSLPGGYVQNVASVRGYQDAMAEGRLATGRGIALSDDDRLRRQVIEQLMCDLSVDVGACCRAHQSDPDTLDTALAALKPMADDGLLEIDDHTVTMTERGRPFVRTAAAAFDGYLEKGVARHSRAI